MKIPPAWFCALLISTSSPLAAVIRVPGQHVSIQAAIDVAAAGDLVLVQPGTYRERVRLKAGIHLRSAGSDAPAEFGLKRAAATIIDGGGAGPAPGVTMAEGATLDGFTITGVGTYDDDKWQKHWRERGDRQSHEDIGQFGIPAVAVTGSTCAVINNLVHHNGNTGIAIRGRKDRPTKPLIARNVCHRNMGGGIGSMEGSTALIVSNLCFENFHAGIGHDNASPTVTRNICRDNIRAGIGISEGASPAVRQNQCFQNRRAGIGIRTGATTRPLVEDNDCHDNGMAGIGIEEAAAPIVSRNRCHRNRLAGIGCKDRATPLLTENDCRENLASGIGLASATATLIRNRCENNRTSGIGISGKSKAVLIGNICAENRLVAVGIPDGGEAILLENTLTRSGKGPPMIAILGGARADLSGNTIQGGGGAGIILSGHLTATGNVITGHQGGVGIAARPGSAMRLSRNTISGFRIPIRYPPGPKPPR